MWSWTLNEKEKNHIKSKHLLSIPRTALSLLAKAFSVSAPTVKFQLNAPSPGLKPEPIEATGQAP